MATNYSYIKGPSDFVYGDDFEMFWKRFQAFVVAAKCTNEAQYSLFLSYLDDVSFRRVQALTFTADHKTGENVDLAKAHLIIKGALSKEPDVPARITLRYKVQGLAEGVTEFGDAIRLLGQKIFGSDQTDGNAFVIDSFCTGLRDTNLGSKMVQKEFKSLSEAIKYAVSRKELTNIKNVLVEQRGKSTE